MTSPYEGMTAVLYARVSTEKATENKRQDTKSQIMELRRWCDANGVEIIAEYADEITGTTIDRPELDRMVGRIVKGGVNMILTLHPDRISRDMEGKAELFKLIKPYGTVIRYLSDLALKPETEDGRLIDTMNTYGGQKYISGHSIKIRAGHARVREHGTKSGKPIGRPPSTIDIDLVMECADRHMPISETAKLMKVGRETLRRHLITIGRFDEYYDRTHEFHPALRKVLDHHGCSKTPMPENTDSLYSPSKKEGGA